MQNTAPPARYDVPWKAALTHAFQAFMAFFFTDLGTRIDWSKRPRFRDKELAGIGFGDAPDRMVADKLVERWPICARSRPGTIRSNSTQRNGS